MDKICTKCGEITEYNGDLHCRKILIEKVKKFIDLKDLESAEKIIHSFRGDEDWEKWKWDMFWRISYNLKRKKVQLEEIQEYYKKQQIKKQIELQISPFFNQAEQLVKQQKFREAEIFMFDKQMSFPSLPILQKYKTDLRHLIPESHHIPISYIPRNDWKSFEKIRTREKLYWLIHITDRQNIESIKHYGGIFSKQAMNEYNIKPYKYASDDLSRELDEYKGLLDYIHLSIKPSPMMYKANINPVTILIDSRFIFAKETMFSDKNSTDNNAIIGHSFEDFERINFSIAKSKWNTEPEKKLFQAEILIKHYIPIEFIKFP
jgi:hypothetical protein